MSERFYNYEITERFSKDKNETFSTGMRSERKVFIGMG